METHDQALLVSFLQDNTGIVFRETDWLKIQNFILENLDNKKVEEIQEMEVPHMNISVSQD